MKFFRKRITESEFAKALTNCTKTARKAYKLTVEYQREVEIILKELKTSLDKKISPIFNDKDVEHFEFYKPLKKMVAELKKRSNNGLRDLKDAVETKSKHLEDFTVTLFGRTKAGKSTIRESITKSGDGSTIGLGKLHATKEVGDYKWKGLRLLDTPGVEGYGGEKEVEKAHEVIDQTDIVIFLTTDESQQPGEFDEMERLLEINKPFFVVLNIKDKLTDPDYLQRFFRRKARLFDNDIIEEHKQRIVNEIKRFGIHNINIVWISALASCIAQFAERGFTSQNKQDFLNSIKNEQVRPVIKWFLENLSPQDASTIWKLSQIEKVYERIALEVNICGRQRRVLTFLDSTINFIDTIVKMLWEHQRSLRARANFMVEKRVELKKFFDGFIEESNLNIERKCENLFSSVKEWIPDFVDEYLGKNNAQSVLKRRLNKERNRIEEEMKGLIDEIVNDLKVKLNEFTQQYKYDIGTIKLEPSDIGDFRKGQTGKILKWTGITSGGISAVAFGVGAFAAANFWNPVGWIAFVVSVGAGILSWLFGRKEEREWLKAKRKAKERIWNSIDKMERKTRGAYKTWFYENITTKGRKAMLDQVSTYIDGLFVIANDLKECGLQLGKLQNQANKELFTWLLQLEGIKCSGKDILSIARVQGIATKIMVSDSWHIDGRIKTNLDKLSGEHILLFRDCNDIRERIARAMFPGKLSLKQIEIFEENGKKIAKIKVPDEEKGLCIGKNGVNIRLASQVSGVDIEII